MGEENLFKRDSRPSISFAVRDPESGSLGSVPKGTRLGGTVIETPKKVRAKNFDTGKPDTWDDGAEKWSIVTGLRCPDGEERNLWCVMPSAIFAAIGDAINATGGAALAEGDQLWITLTGFKPNETDKSKAPQKLYEAEVIRGAGAFQAAAIPAPPASVPAPPAPALTLDALTSNGWTMDQIKAHHPHLVPTNGNGSVPAPPPAEIPAQMSKDEALAKLSPDDIAALQLSK